jgi:hypothetical protein
LVDGWGNVSEHYRTEGDDLILLPFPDLLLDDASDGSPRPLCGSRFGPRHCRGTEHRSTQAAILHSSSDVRRRVTRTMKNGRLTPLQPVR